MNLKFSITHLEKARKSPVEFAKQIKDEASTVKSFRGYPKSLRWLNAINIYHKFNDVSKAYLSIEEAFSHRKSTSKNHKEVEMFLEAISNYDISIRKNKYNLIKGRELINIKLTTALRISGQIPIILMKQPVGFAAFFISKNNPNWESELKFPVIQNYVAKDIFNTELHHIDVGYIDFYTGEFYHYCYSKNEIVAALKELKKIGDTISSNL